MREGSCSPNSRDQNFGLVRELDEVLLVQLSNFNARLESVWI